MTERNNAQEDDFIIPFQLGTTAIRGRVVRLGPVIDEILTRHAFAESLSMLLGESAALVAMLGASLKFDGKVILQAQGDGPVAMVVADFTKGGALRATAKIAQDKAHLIAKAQGAELHYLLQKGHIAVTIDQGAQMERYQGVTPLEGANFATAIGHYFDRSEQIPTMVVLAVGRVMHAKEAYSWRAGGMMVQLVPTTGGKQHTQDNIAQDAQQEAWRYATTLMQTVQPDELLDPTLPPTRLLYRLFHEQGVRMFGSLPVHFACTCSQEKIMRVLAQYSEDEIMALCKNGVITAACEFCKQNYEIDYRALRQNS